MNVNMNSDTCSCSTRVTYGHCHNHIDVSNHKEFQFGECEYVTDYTLGNNTDAAFDSHKQLQFCIVILIKCNES